MSAYRTVASQRAFSGFSSIRIDTLEGPGGRFVREVVEHPDAVGIVALDGAGQVALVRQYRHPLGADLLEIPAGTLDVPGESPEDAARRELAEEVGLAAETLVPLGTLWNSAGWSDERTHLFLAPTTSPVAVPEGYVPEGEEVTMRIEWRSLASLLSDVRGGVIEDAKSVVALVRAAAALEDGGGGRQ